ncbi:MAG: single-stranded-DNA-specific exonuclease RecJ [Methylophilaceae bacterium]|nr:single-stranded-DNA-specific exonuclease RecJ [Methylophilaceae bacterium]
MRVRTRILNPAALTSLLASGISPLLARLYAARGVSDFAECQTTSANLLPPDDLYGSRAMAECLADAIVQQQKILVIGDYDADGATATTVAVRGLRALGAQVDFLVPNRFEYGYGLTPEIVELAASRYAPHIILTVDNGIASIEGVEMANTLGIGVLVTDHHLPASQLPNALVIVNPNQPACRFASKHLAGVGVMFYVLLALRCELKRRGIWRGTFNLASLLDLVALGTVADLVKLDTNNRILVDQGLRRIRAGASCYGILALFTVSAKSYLHANVHDIGFSLAPRLNAAGRLDDMSIGIRCLLADSQTQADELAQQLNRLNNSRKEIESQMHTDCELTLDDTEVQQQYSLSVYQTGWHQGVVGILASRLKARYYRPVIAFADAGDGVLKGSGRSIANFHLRDALDVMSKQAPDLLLKFGGHAFAAGVSIKALDFERFRLGFEQVARHQLTEVDLHEFVEIDGGLSLAEMSIDNAQLLMRQVWGQGFVAPLFCDDFIVIDQQILAGTHSRLKLKKQGRLFEAIYFRYIDILPAQVTLLYELGLHYYQGRASVQLKIQQCV